MVKIYVKLVEQHAYSINMVPANLRDQVREMVIADGYYFDKDGWAHKGFNSNAVVEEDETV